MSGEISQLLPLLGAAKDLGLALLNERDRQKATTIQIDLSEKILQAQAQLAEVLGAIIEKDRAIQALGERVRELEAHQLQKARYRLAKVGTFGEFHAYGLRPASELVERADEPQHFLCQPCLDIRKSASILRIRDGLAICTECKTRAPIVAAAAVSATASGATAKVKDW